MARLLIVRHHWRGGEMAEWRMHPSFPSRVLAEFRARIAELQHGEVRCGAERVAGEWVGVVVFEEREMYGRPAPHFVALWTRGLDHDSAEEVARLAEIMPEMRDPAVLEIDLPFQASAAKVRSSTWIAIAVSVALVGLVATLWMFEKSSSKLNAVAVSSTEPWEHLQASPFFAREGSVFETASPRSTVPSEPERVEARKKLCSALKQRTKDYRGYCWFEYLRERCASVPVSFAQFSEINLRRYSCPNTAISLNHDADFTNAPRRWKQLVKRLQWR